MVITNRQNYSQAVDKIHPIKLIQQELGLKKQLGNVATDYMKEAKILKVLNFLKLIIYYLNISQREKLKLDKKVKVTSK